MKQYTYSELLEKPRMVLVKLPGLHFSWGQSSLPLHWLQPQSTHNSLCLSNNSCLNELRSQLIFCCNSVQHLTLAQVLTGIYSSITIAFRSSRKFCPIVCVENGEKIQLPVIAWWNYFFKKCAYHSSKWGCSQTHESPTQFWINEKKCDNWNREHEKNNSSSLNKKFKSNVEKKTTPH